MAINKVIYGNDTLVDLTGDTVDSGTLLQGVIAHNAAGVQITGTAVIPLPAVNTPENLGTAAIGSSSRYALEDHVHTMPSANDVGAIGVPASASIGDVITYTSNGWSAAPPGAGIVAQIVRW